MNILVYGNCQTNQLVTGLKLALLGQSNILGIDINQPNTIEKLKSITSSQNNTKADIVITNHDINELLPYFDKSIIVEIPSIHFGGFHPDVAYFALKEKPTLPLFYLNNPTISALALWGITNKLPLEKTLSLFNEKVFEELGYMDYFDVASHAILKSYESHNIKSAYIEKHLCSRNVFMYGPLHPKFEVTLSLVYGAIEKLNLKPSMPYDNINNMIPDPLQNEYTWGCFPPIADKLGVQGSWLIRHNNQTFPMIKYYLTSFYEYMSQFNQGPVQLIERDKNRFDNFHKIDSVLERQL